MTLNFSGLKEHLPLQAIEVPSIGEIKINCNAIMHNSLTLESSIVELIGKLLQAAYEQVSTINEERRSENFVLPPIEIIDKTIKISDTGNAIHEFVVSIEVTSSPSFDFAIDPVP